MELEIPGRQTKNHIMHFLIHQLSILNGMCILFLCEGISMATEPEYLGIESKLTRPMNLARPVPP